MDDGLDIAGGVDDSGIAAVTGVSTSPLATVIPGSTRFALNNRHFRYYTITVRNYVNGFAQAQRSGSFSTIRMETLVPDLSTAPRQFPGSAGKTVLQWRPNPGAENLPTFPGPGMPHSPGRRFFQAGHAIDIQGPDHAGQVIRRSQNKNPASKSFLSKESRQNQQAPAFGLHDIAGVFRTSISFLG